jgi:prepilin-type N-terminal cleavage/methylation domain-containing protein
MRRINKNSGFTLIEVVLIIVIMGIIATVAMKTMEPAMDQSRIDATLREMEIMSQAIIGNKNLISDGIRSDFGYVGDVGALPPNLDALVSNPGSYATWRGPYIMSDFLENPDDYKEDAWGNSYNYSDVIITSPGNGSPITRRFAESVDELLSNTVNGSIYDGLNAVPGDSVIPMAPAASHRPQLTLQAPGNFHFPI